MIQQWYRTCLVKIGELRFLAPHVARGFRGLKTSLLTAVHLFCYILVRLRVTTIINRNITQTLYPLLLVVSICTLLPRTNGGKQPQNLYNTVYSVNRMVITAATSQVSVYVETVIHLARSALPGKYSHW